MRKYREDNVPLLVETTDNDPGYRREGRTVYLHHNQQHNRTRVRFSFGMIQLFIAFIFVFLITMCLMYLANRRISAKLENLNKMPTTKNYRMVPDFYRHRLTRTQKSTTKKADLFMQRFTKKKTTIKINQKPSTTTRKTVKANIDKNNLVTFKGDWQCGTAAISKQVTKELIEQDCPSLLNGVNGCCIVHDHCYDDQLGQTDCDVGFCQCLSTVTLHKKKCHDEHSTWFCQMVQSFGDTYYQNAGLNTTLHSGFQDIFGVEATVNEMKDKKSRVRQKRI